MWIYTICLFAILPESFSKLIEMCTIVFVKYLMCPVVVLYIIMVFPSIRGDDCNEFVCGSIVSKCLLTRSCECKLSDSYCCKTCHDCMGELYEECCSCLEMCPKQNKASSALATASQTGDFRGENELFNSYTAIDDEDQWTTMRFPMKNNLQRHYNMTTDSFGDTVNCTIIYWNECQTEKKCIRSCESMGSNGYRWFNDGCCECIGPNCYNHGINESQCSACPDNDEEDEDINEDDMTYGEDENDYY